MTPGDVSPTTAALSEEEAEMLDIVLRLGRLEEKLGALSDKLDMILDQARITNGTVREHSEWKCGFTAACDARRIRFEDIERLSREHERYIREQAGTVRMAIKIAAVVAGIGGSIVTLAITVFLRAVKLL